MEMPVRPADKRVFEMTIIERYRRLTLWSKLSVWGSAASICGFAWLLLPARSAPAGRLVIGYLDAELNNTEITLEKTPVDPPTSQVQRHALVDPSHPTVFDLYGLWVRNAGDAAIEAESMSVYLNFDADVAQMPAVSSCWRPFPSTEAGFASELRCVVGRVSISPGQRWEIPWFNGTPVPKQKMKAKIRMFFGRTSEAAFLIVP